MTAASCCVGMHDHDVGDSLYSSKVDATVLEGRAERHHKTRSEGGGIEGYSRAATSATIDVHVPRSN